MWRWKESWRYNIRDVLDGLGWYIFSKLPQLSPYEIEVSIDYWSFFSHFRPVKTLSVFTHLLPFSLKGKCSGAVIRLREIINNVKWALAWLSFKAAGLGWYEISHIYWKSGKKWEISYLSYWLRSKFSFERLPFLTFAFNLHFNCWLVHVSYGVIVHARANFAARGFAARAPGSTKLPRYSG